MCFDARRVAEGIEYEVVVNSDSGGFIDTLEHGVVAVSEVNAIAHLPEYWCEIGAANGRMYSPRKCGISWRRHLARLVEETP